MTSAFDRGGAKNLDHFWENIRIDFDAPAHPVWKVDEQSEDSKFADDPLLALCSALLELPAVWKKLQVIVDQDDKKRTFHLFLDQSTKTYQELRRNESADDKESGCAHLNVWRSLFLPEGNGLGI